MTIVVREQAHLSDAELDHYAKIAASAFDYQFFASALNNDKTLQEPFLRAHMTGALIEGDGEVHIAELDGIGPVGLAVWFGPGHMFLDSEAQREAGYNQVIAKLPIQLQKWWPKFFKQYESLSEIFLGPGVKLGGYHLQLIAVSPGHQGMGVGTALMRYGESKAFTSRVPSILETSGEDNIAFYKALGYTLAGSGPIYSPPPSPGTFEMVVFVKHTEDTE